MSSPTLHSQSISSPQLHSPHLHSQGVNTGSSDSADMDVASSSQRSHICTTCVKGFRSKQQLAQHTLVHSNVRKYTCSYCERAFKQLSHLQQHTRIHTGEKPYCCKFEGCDRAFAQLSNLQHHMRNHDDQVKKEASRIHRCLVCHRSYTNESSLKAHTLKMHVHINKVPPEGAPNPDGTTTKKRKRRKKNQLYNSPTMVPLSSHDGRSSISIGKKMSSESSSDDDLIIIGENKKGEDDISHGGMPRSLVESLNHYERTLAAGMMGGAKKLQDSNISSSNQFGVGLGGGGGSGNTNGGPRGNRFDHGRGGGLGLQGLMGLPGMDPALMSSQHPEMIERAAAAAAAAVSSQLHGLNHNPGGGSGGMHGGQNQSHSQMLGKSGTTSADTHPATTRTPTPNAPLLSLDMMGMGGGQYGGQNPYLSASHLMDAHLRSQLTPMSLPVVPEQYPAHCGPPSLGGGLSHHARYLAPRGMQDLAMSYGQQLPSSQSFLTSTASSSHQLTSPGIHHGGSRPPSVMESPSHVSESLNFNP